MKKDFVYFISLRPTLASYGFSTYDDPQTGEVHFLAQSKQANGDFRKEWFTFTPLNRSIKIPVNKKDIRGKSYIEFLRNHPDCEGSPNGNYHVDENGRTIQHGVWYRELKEEQDASIAIDNRKLRIDAENIAINLPLAECKELGSILGIQAKGPHQMKFSLMEFAQNNPELFMKTYNAPDRKVRGAVKAGIEQGILTKTGTVISWDKTILGSDENEAVALLIKNSDLMYGLLHKLGKEVPEEEEKKKAGRPPKK